MWARTGLFRLIVRQLFVQFAVAAGIISPVFADESRAMTRFRDEIEPILAEHCYACHGAGISKAGVTLDRFESDQALFESRDLWWRVLKNVRAGVMPPVGEPRPTDAQQQRLAEWIKRDAFGVDPRHPDPGRVTLRRLNRTEYRNTIRDLTGFDFRADEEFPPDDTGYGFDNIGDVLSVSPLLLEKYMQAADSIVAAAVPTVSRTVPETRAKNYERFFPRDDPPETQAERRVYAGELLAASAAKAFRRPVDALTIDRLTSIAETIYNRPNTRFEEGIAQALVAVLASPRFLFRVEPPIGTSEGIASIDDYALASRLSYFLWSTMPDDELFRLAELGVLRERLGPQVRRMLTDDRSRELIDNFIGQWLQVRDVEGIAINARAVLRREGIRNRDEIFDGELRRAMRRETELVFGHIVKDDRSLLELLDSDYTFLNEKLAKHYGIAGVDGKQMRLVNLDSDSPRGGVLTQGAVLAVTSNPTRTSPVKRGLFVLDNILGTPAPPPPAAVPELEAAEKEFKDREPTMREVMELHRQQPLCHACHSRMDPLGLALENFNAMGMWRDIERGQPIDTKGQLITGESIAGIRELKRVLTHERRRDFYRCVTEKLLTYALGRGLEYYDVETVDQIAERLEREQGRASALILGIVESSPFQKRREGTR